MSSSLNRRNLIKKVIAGSAAIAAGVVIPKSVLATVQLPEETTALKGNINHSVCRWCYSDMPLDTLCKLVKEIGFNAIDLLKPNEWPIAKQYGIDCSMCYTAGETSLTKG
jgi:hydroxypyruvate isomerase